MNIEKLPSNLLLQMEESVSTFSGDSRLIYMVSCENGILKILVYDIMFNKCITLLPDSSITELFKQIKGFKISSEMCDFEVVTDTTLLILFNDRFCFDFDGISAFLILVELDYSDKIFSLIDNRMYEDCFYAALLKDALHFGLLHSFAVDKEMFSGDEFLGYFHLEVNKNQIKQTQEHRIIFDFDEKYFPSSILYNYHLYDNKLWVLHFKAVDLSRRYRNSSEQEPSTKPYQLSYFDLTELKPKEIKVQQIDILTDRPRWIRNNVIFYNEDEAEFLILNLTNGKQSRLKNPAKLIPVFDKYCNDLIYMNMSPRIHGTRRTYQFFIDQHYNVTFIDKTKKQLQRIPLKEPLKLGDIVWTNALNHDMLDENESKKLPNNLNYTKLF